MEINNLGLHEDTKIEINKPLIAFYGDIKQGKTTILNAVKLCFGGGFPGDIIRRGENEGYVFMTFEGNTTINRSFYRNKEGITVSRPISFVQGGRVVKNPVKALQELINPFILDNEVFLKMTATERQKFLAELFNVDTSEEDAEIKELEKSAKNRRAEIKGFGEINVVPVEKPDVEELRRQKDEILNENRETKEKYGTERAEIDEYNRSVVERDNQRESAISELEELNKKIEAINIWLDKNPELQSKDIPKEPVLKGTTELDEKISNAKADELKYELYQQALKKQADKEAQQELLNKDEESLKAKRKEKIDKLIDISDKSGIDGLEFKEGGFMYRDVDDGMLSTSDLLELSTKLAGLYSDGLKLELVDRGESLGKSIQDLANNAQENERTILVTVVGDAPAEIPSNIGVFVVENGKVVEK